MAYGREVTDPPPATGPPPARDAVPVLPDLAAILADAPIGFGVFDHGMRYRLVNRRLSEINGVPPEAHIGRRPEEVLPEMNAEALEPLRRALRGEIVPSRETHGITPARPGEERHWLVSWLPVRAVPDRVTHAAVFVEDITERKRAERTISESERFLRRVLDALFTFAGVMTPDGTLIEVNRPALEVAGVRPEDVLDRPLWETYWFAWDPDVQRDVREAAIRAAAGEVSRYDTDVRIGPDRRLTIDFQLVPMRDAGGRITHLIPSAADVTGVRALERERGRLLEAERTARSRAEGLADLSARLAPALDRHEVAAVVGGGFAGLTGAVGVVLSVVEAHPPRLRALVHVGHPPAVLEAFHVVPLTERLPVTDAVRGRAPVYVATRQGLLERYPHLAEVVAGLQDRAWAMLPLEVDGRVMGVLGLIFHEERPFDDAERRYLEAIARQCTQALTRAGLYERQRAIAEGLQRALLPPRLPRLAGLEVAARYEAAGEGLEIGGDFYEVLATGDGALVAIGDVCGRGPEAAGVGALLRHAVRLLGGAGAGAAELCRLLDAELRAQRDDGLFATMAVAHLRPDGDGHRAHVAVAGHEPPLVVRRGGGVEVVRARGHLLGVVTDPVVEEEVVRLGPGDALALYTDGIVGGLGADPTPALVAGLAGGAPRAPAAIADLLIARAQEGARPGGDDAAVVVVGSAP